MSVTKTWKWTEHDRFLYFCLLSLFSFLFLFFFYFRFSTFLKKQKNRLLLSLPLFHTHGLGVGLHGTLVSGGSAVIFPKFAADDVLAAAKREKATLFFGVPTMYRRLLQSPDVKNLANMRLLVSGSAPMPVSMHEAVRAATGLPVTERMGMTETQMLFTNPVDRPGKAGTVGLPFPGVEHRLAADGEIEVRGPALFSEYINNADATAHAFSADGFFKTGDIGSQDDDGFVTIRGRKSDTVIVGGENIFPAEIEEVMRPHDRVTDCAVIGLPDEEYGERVVLVVENTSGQPLTLEEMQSFIGDKLAKYKWPREVHNVDALPRNALGKVVKGELKQKFS